MENRSIAKKINNYWLGTALGNFIALDIITLAASVVLKCRTEELAAGVNSFFIPRSFGITDADGIIYRFADKSVNLDTFAVTLANILIVMAAAELVMLAAGAFRGARKAKSILRPIDEMAVSAKDIAASSIEPPASLAEIPAPDENGKNDMDLSDLQSAIDNVDPMAAVYVRTGNSDLKGLEDAVNSLLDRMRESYRRQTRFVNDASHELRTPIAVIQGYANMLDRWGKTDEKVLDESVSAIKNESEHIGKLLEQLLFLARSDNGRQSMNKDIFSLSDTVRDICSEYRMIDDKHNYICDINGDFDAFGDPSMIKQTIRILTDNAKKYTPDGGEISLRIRRSVQGEICVDVQDTGIGMEQKDIEHIFDRFYRADPARNRDTGGTGLGLSIAKRIVDSHGGRFDVASCVGIGTRMTVVMPKLNIDSGDFVLDDIKTPAQSTGVRSVIPKK